MAAKYGKGGTKLVSGWNAVFRLFGVDAQIVYGLFKSIGNGADYITRK